MRLPVVQRVAVAMLASLAVAGLLGSCAPATAEPGAEACPLTTYETSGLVPGEIAPPTFTDWAAAEVQSTNVHSECVWRVDGGEAGVICFAVGWWNEPGRIEVPGTACEAYPFGPITDGENIEISGTSAYLHLGDFSITQADSADIAFEHDGRSWFVTVLARWDATSTLPLETVQESIKLQAVRLAEAIAQKDFATQ